MNLSDLWTGASSSPWTAAAVVVLVLRLTVIGALAHLSLVALRRRAAALRHLVASVALAAMLAVTAVFAAGSWWPSLSVPVDALPTFIRPAGASLAVAAPEHVVARPRPRAHAAAALRARADAPTVAAVEPRAEAEPLATTVLPVGVATSNEYPAMGPWTPYAPLPIDGRGLALALVLGVLPLLALGHVVAAIATCCRAAAARPVHDPRLLESLDRARAAVDCRTPIALRSSPTAGVPFVTGLLRPALILPEDALDWDGARLHAVFLHEAGHVVRGDGFTLLLARAATTLAWFHPLAWTLARSAHRECERACDDLVLAAGVRPSTYAEELLAVARAAGHLAAWHTGSLAMAHPRQLEGRLLAILSADTRRGPVSRRAAAVATAVTLALLVPLTSVRVVAASGGCVTKDECRETQETSVEVRTETTWSTSPEAVPEVPAVGACDPTPATPAVPAVPPVPPERRSTERRLTDPEGPLAAALQFANEGSHSGDEWYSAAHDRYQAGRYGEAGEFYERAARAEYRTGTSWYNAGCSFSLDGQVNRALGALHQAIENGFDDPSMFQGDDDLNPLRREARFRMMVSELLDSDAGESARRTAVAKYEEVIRAGSPEPHELRSAGVELMRSGEPQLAIEAFTREYARDSSSSALYNKSCAQAIGGRTNEALATLERAIREGSGDGDQLTDDPDLYALHDRPEFDRVAKLADDLSLDMGDWNDDSADEWRSELGRYERVTREHPDIGRAWFNLGFAQLRAGNPRDSHGSFQRALDLGYRRPTTLYNLACASARSGDTDEALKWLERSEAAGFEMGSTARGDDDLASLRHDARFRSMMARWDREHPHDRRSAGEKNKDKDRLRKSS